MLVAFTLLALGLVLLSVYGVTMSLVVRRQRELGVRMAVGCGPAALRVEVLGWALVPVLAGLAAGSVVSGWAVRAIGSAMAVPSPLTLPWILACALCVVSLVGLALLHPVRRAERIPLSRILRE